MTLILTSYHSGIIDEDCWVAFIWGSVPVSALISVRRTQGQPSSWPYTAIQTKDLLLSNYRVYQCV